MNFKITDFKSVSFLSKRLIVASFASIIAIGVSSEAYSQTAAFQISGDGVIGEDSVRVGEDFTLDLYLSNGAKVTGFTLGFQLSGKDGLKAITHLWPKGSDNPESNITTFNGFDTKEYWDMTGTMKPVFSWDGRLPDSVLIGGVAMNKGWPKTEKATHYLSIAVRANSAGTLCVDSAYIPPSGAWLFSPKPSPVWEAEYCVTAVAAKSEGK